MIPQTALEVLSSIKSNLIDTSPESVRRYSHLDAKGIYAFFADECGQDVLRRADLAVRDDRLVYVGMTEGSFRERVLGKHVKGSVSNSTLRKTLAGVLRTVGTETDVTGFMRVHLQVAFLPIDNVALIQPLEDKLIAELSPPLCAKGLDTSNARRVRELRKK